MRDGLVSVSVGTGTAPSAEANDARVNLRVEERVSGVVLVDVDFTPAEFWRLIIGAVRTQMARVPSPDQVALIGMQMDNDSAMVPREVYDHIRMGKHDEERAAQEVAGRQWSLGHWSHLADPKQISVRWSNGGLSSHVRYWAPPVPCEVCGLFPGDHDWSLAREHGVS